MTLDEAIAILNHNISACLHGTEWGEALDMAIQALEQEPCEEAISRDAVKEIINDIRDCISVEGYWAILERVEKLPPVKPQEPKTVHWRHYEGMLTCSECGAEFYDDIMEYCGDDVPKCCPDCGARMVKPQETKQPEISSYYGLKSYVRERSEE